MNDNRKQTGKFQQTGNKARDREELRSFGRANGSGAQKHLPTELVRLREPRRRRRIHATDAAMFKAKREETATNSERREAAQRSLKTSGLGAWVQVRTAMAELAAMLQAMQQETTDQ
jgi:hypothetical protein